MQTTTCYAPPLDTFLGLIELLVLLRALYHVSTPMYPVIVAFYRRTIL